MADSMDEILIAVWRAALVEKAKRVRVGDETFAVRETAKRRLRQVDFQAEGREMRGLEQNPDTKSRWAALARKGQKVMQFLEGGRYVAVVADGKIFTYGRLDEGTAKK